MRTASRNPAELADEYVIGLCDTDEQREVEQRLNTDQDIAVHVELARLRFANLDAATPDVAVPENFWSRINSALDVLEAGADAIGSDALETAPSKDASDTVVPFDPQPQKRSRRMTWFVAANIAATLLLALTVFWMSMTRVDPQVVAVLLDDGGQPVAMIEGQQDNTTRVTLLGDIDVPAGSILQLWTKPDPDGAPVSIGIFDEPRQTILEAVGLPAPTTDQLYEITFEQPGGSPTGLPTGPILGKGFTKEPN